MKTFRLLLGISILFAAISCSKKSDALFTIEGKISDADTATLYLEKRELNKASVIDSVKLNSDGEFKFEASSTPYPEFYVLRLNGQVINLVIDSVESVKINASAKTFATDYTVEGSEANQDLKTITLAQYKAGQSLIDLQKKVNNKEIDASAFLEGIQEIASAYKTEANNLIYANPKNPAAYFALFQKINGYLFFDPYEKADYGSFGAVATSWDTFYSESPRAPHIKDFTLKALKIRKQGEQAPIDIENAKEITAKDYYKIELPNAQGNPTSIESLKGKVVLLDFTLYQANESPAHNMALYKIYTKFKPNLEIYQVSFDSDPHLWKNAAVNLPWIAVHDINSMNSDLIFKYNIQGLPSLYLFNKEGELTKRILPTDNIEAEIQKII